MNCARKFIINAENIIVPAIAIHHFNLCVNLVIMNFRVHSARDAHKIKRNEQYTAGAGNHAGTVCQLSACTSGIWAFMLTNLHRSSLRRYDLRSRSFRCKPVLVPRICHCCTQIRPCNKWSSLCMCASHGVFTQFSIQCK